MNVLALTQSFVRTKYDSKAVFMVSLYMQLQKKGVHALVIAPHLKNSEIYEVIQGVKVKRFRYAPVKYERLAYSGMMHERVIKSFPNKVLFILFIISFILQAVKSGNKERVDLIHAHWWIPSGIVALIVSFILRKPYVITSHGTDVFILKKFTILKKLAKIVFGKASLITVVSNSLKSILIKDIGITPEKIKVFPMPCDLSLFFPTRVDKNKKVILSIGRFVKRKGFKYLVEAIKTLTDKGIDIKLIIIGEGPEKDAIRKKVQQLGLSDVVDFIPYQPKSKLNYFYNLCDIFILPSITDWKAEQEGLGLVLLEAMACKKPVIGTNSGGIPDIIKDGKTGLLVPEKDSKALAVAIEKLLKDINLSNSLAENAYIYSRDNFSIPKITEKMLNVYSKVLL